MVFFGCLLMTECSPLLPNNPDYATETHRKVCMANQRVMAILVVSWTSEVPLPDARA